jgi:hypothetical protein
LTDPLPAETVAVHVVCVAGQVVGLGEQDTIAVLTAFWIVNTVLLLPEV